MSMHFTYADLVDRFGEPRASHCLAEIEKAAGIKPQLTSTDPEARLAHAIKLQDVSSQPSMVA
jgi:hypothetical protein